MKLQVYIISHSLVDNKLSVLIMSNFHKRQQSSPTRKGLTETEEIESMLNMNDISEIQPESTNEDLLRRINKLETELQEAINDRQMKEKLLENSKKTQRTLEGFHENYKKKISMLQEKVKSLESGQAESSGGDASNKELEAKIRSLNETIDKLRKDNTRANQEIEKIKQKDFERERELDQLRAAKEELSSKLKKVEASAASQTKNSKNYQAKIKELEEKVKSLQGKTENVKVQVKKEVVIDHSAVDKLKEQNSKLTAELNKSKAEVASLKKEQAELEKKQKKTETELLQTTKARQSLKQRVKELEESVRQLKRDADSSKRQEGEETEMTVKEQTILNEKEDKDEDENFEIHNPVEKQTKKILKTIFSKESTCTEERVKYLNSIIINAEMELDRLSI